MKDKSKIILIIAIIAIAAIIAYVCYGAIKGQKKPVATMEVSYIDNDGNQKTGTVKIELNPDVAPESVANFIKLADNGFYDGLTFHRLITDFMIQGGDKEGTGAGSAKLSDIDKKIQADSSADYTYSIKGEFAANGVNNNLKFEKGVIGMARSDYSSYGLTQQGYDSASSQFFIVTTDDKDTLNSLNQSYAAFGKVIEGYEFIEEIANIYGKDSDEESSEDLSITKSEEENSETGKIKVTLTSNKELDTTKLPEGWTISEETTSISKEMDKDAIEKMTITAKDGTTLDYAVIAGKDNVPYIVSIRVDTFGADYGMPETINYDEVMKTVQQYQNYYQQLMSSYSSSETDTTTEDVDTVEE